MKIDKISLKTAQEQFVWKFVYATEPQRKINVEMTYVDLMHIVHLLKEENENTNRD